MNSDCCKKHMLKQPLWSGQEKLGYGYVCTGCKDIRYYEGQFRFEGWEVREGTKGYGCYYKGKGIRNRSKTNRNAPQAYKTNIPMHGLGRTEALGHNAWVKED